MNTSICENLEKLCNAPGCAGLPDIRKLAENLLFPLTDRVWSDSLGNVLAIRQGTDGNGPTILLEAHMDEIGFLVTGADENGFLHVAPAGGVDQRILSAQAVTVHGDRPYYGVFCSVPPHLSKGEATGIPAMDERGIDVGMTQQEALRHIPLGSRVTFDAPFCRMAGDTVSSKALDDRAGMAAILHALRKIGRTAATVAVAFCVQEELGCRGAKSAALALKPDAALVTDVSFAQVPGENPRECADAGKGVMIGVSPVLNPSITGKLFALAEENRIPHQTEVMAETTGTDADTISLASTGIPTGLLSIPLKYMHTPVESVCVQDIEAVGDLMAAFVEERGAV